MYSLDILSIQQNIDHNHAHNVAVQMRTNSVVKDLTGKATSTILKAAVKVRESIGTAEVSWLEVGLVIASSYG
ncbi:hypothetical protein Tco_0269453 [Tanacetum coccineum]